jgi:hypothetical protein
MLGQPAKVIDEKGRCCGRKPIPYRRPPTLFCPRCDAQFDPETGKQIPNWAFEKMEDGSFRDRFQRSALKTAEGKQE